MIAKEVDNMTEKERIDTQLATIYLLRLQLIKSDKNDYTKDEILQMLDTIALEKSTN